MLTVRNTATLVLGLAFASATAKANTVVLTQNAYSYYVGGEFNAVTSPGNFLGDYSPLAIVGNGFETFCVETTVDFYPGATYSYDLSDKDSLGRNLTLGAAFLYSDFAKGVLPGYDYTDPTIRNTDAGELQAAIWWLQGNQTYGGYPSLSGNVFYQYATNQLGALAETANDGHYAVDILQMWSSNGQAAQNQLVMPDQAETWFMLAIGLAGLGAASPFLRQQKAPATVKS